MQGRSSVIGDLIFQWFQQATPRLATPPGHA
jgi:hypothetical protein